MTVYLLPLPRKYTNPPHSWMCSSDAEEWLWESVMLHNSVGVRDFAEKGKQDFKMALMTITP